MVDGLVGLPVTLLAGAVLESDRAVNVVMTALVAVYQISLHALRGQTLGKVVAGTQVVDVTSGDRIGVGQAVIRWAVVLLGPLIGFAFGYTGPLVGLYVLVILAPILQPPLHRGIHDRAAGTVVTSLR